ncbi:MAG: response regulator [Gloeobacteraceae cyanobacterium ES-bin-144]|nr:response regulator [Verrucomicrobiales bacterium]
MISTPRILIVDDEPLILWTLSKALEADGHQITSASNGEEAIRIARTQQFDLFIIDLIMPYKDGIETMLELRALDKDTPIIAMSGGWNGGAKSCLPLAGKMGACAMLAKPFDRTTLLAIVGHEIRKRQVFPV